MAPRLAIVASHPIQYVAPMLRALTREIDMHVLYAHTATADDQARAGFGVPFDWDVDLLSGYGHTFLANVSRMPGTDHFTGCDTPEIGRQLGGGRFDAVLIMGWHLKSCVQAAVAANRLGLAVLVRGDSQLATPRRRWKTMAKAMAYPPLMRLADALLPVGQRSRDYFKRYGVPEARLHIAPHCVDIDWFRQRGTRAARERLRRELGIKGTSRVALFAGRLVASKRPTDVVGAAAQLRRGGQPVEVVVAGDGALREALVAKARALGVPLHMLGFCNQSRLPDVYAAADCLVLPSDGHETWGLVANEALAAGRPVVLSDACGAAPDLATDGVAGRSYPVGDVDALAHALDAMLAPRERTSAVAALAARYSPAVAATSIRMAVEAVRWKRRL